MAKWLIYTVLLGLSPVITRSIIVFFASADENVPWIHTNDIIAFGFIVSITNINVLEHEVRSPASWKTCQIGISLFSVILFATLFAASVFDELSPYTMDSSKIMYGSLFFAFATFVYSFSIWYYIARLPPHEGSGA